MWTLVFEWLSLLLVGFILGFSIGAYSTSETILKYMEKRQRAFERKVMRQVRRMAEK